MSVRIERPCIVLLQRQKLSWWPRGCCLVFPFWWCSGWPPWDLTENLIVNATRIPPGPSTVVPRWPQDGPTTAQEGFEMAVGRSILYASLRRYLVSPTKGAEMTQCRPKMGRRRPKIATRYVFYVTTCLSRAHSGSRVAGTQHAVVRMARFSS